MKTNYFFSFFAAICLMTATVALGAEPEHKTRKVQEDRTESESPEEGTGKREQGTEDNRQTVKPSNRQTEEGTGNG